MGFPKFSVANMLLLMAVLVLCLSIVFNRQQRTVSVDGGYFEFEVPEVSICKSKWNDHSVPPGIDVVAVVEIGNRVSDYLDSQKDKIGHDNWKISSIALHNLGLELAEENTWAYIVSLSPQDRYPDRDGVEQVVYLEFGITFDGEKFYNSALENEEISEALASFGMNDGQE